MKAMEEVAEREWSEALSEGQAIKPHSISKVVPIFGLVISCFARLENELQTVTELWHKPTSPSSLSPPLSPPGDR
jgi:hypothetical protein